MVGTARVRGREGRVIFISAGRRVMSKGTITQYVTDLGNKQYQL